MTSKGKKGKNSNMTSSSNNQAPNDAHEQHRAVESPPLGWIEDRTGAPSQALTPLSSRNTTSTAPKSKTTKDREPAKNRKSGWSVEWGRPQIPFMLRELSDEWTGRKACVFVCGPPSMRVDVSNTVAKLQTKVLSSGGLDEIYLHSENYSL